MRYGLGDLRLALPAQDVLDFTSSIMPGRVKETPLKPVGELQKSKAFESYMN